jgi:alpha-mannosidase
VRAVLRIAMHVAEVPVTERLTLYHALKRLDIENRIDWQTPRSIRIEQWFPVVQANAAIHYGVPFGANDAANIMPQTGPRASDEITRESWLGSRHVHDWIHAGDAEWGLTIATDHQQIRLGDGIIRGEMLRGARFTSVKVVRGGEAGSLAYPPPGRYVFRYSLSSAAGDWKTAKAYRTGMGLTNPLLPIEVTDLVSSKPLPPSQSFCSLKADNVVISALKKADNDSSLLLRVYEIEGTPVKTPVEFLQSPRTFTETNLLEEETSTPRQTLEAGPYSIRTLKLPVGAAHK